MGRFSVGSWERDLDILNRVDFKWEPAASKISWEKYYEELKAFKEKTGHCNVPQLYEENRLLGGWVHSQRKDYEARREGKKSPMTPARIELLEAVGFKWKLRQNRPKKKKSDSSSTTAKAGKEEEHPNYPHRVDMNAGVDSVVE